jgi:16S rRNA (cytosine1402-N4)-methyltransferase
MSDFGHIPVLCPHVVRLLAPRPGQTLADCTAGLGGHAVALAQAALAAGGPLAHIVLNDFDPANLGRATAAAQALSSPPSITPIRGNFAALPQELSARNIRADMVLADIGFASSQMDDASRGMSFMRDGPLDMRMDPAGPITAADLVNRSSEQELFRILREFGEERDAGRIVRAIVKARAAAPITTTAALAEVIRQAMPPSFKQITGIDPSTRTFQALRIAVNDELGNLDGLLDAIADAARAAGRGSPTWLAPGARIAIISFHSLEDRAVKRAFAALVAAGLGTDSRGSITEADDDERRDNPRSRSAKMRVLTLS